MADEISKKAIVSIQVANDDAVNAVSSLDGEVQNLSQSLKQAKIDIANAKAATADLTRELAKGKVEQQNIKTAIDKARLAQIEANAAAKEAKNNFQAAAGSYREAQQQLTALGNAIKNAAGGFKSSDPAIKAQIENYRKLNAQLKQFDAKMGNYQRNVGGYTEALSGINQVLSRVVPGFTQFSSILQGVSKGFNAMKGAETEVSAATEGAEGAAEGLSGAMAGLAAGILAVVAALAAEATYLLQFQKYADGASKTWEGIKTGAVATMGALNNTGKEMIATGNASLDLATTFSNAFTAAYALKGELIDLGRAAKNSATLTMDEDNQVRLLVKDMRDRTTSAKQALEDYNKILQINEAQYKRTHDIAVSTYNREIELSAVKFGLNKKEILQLEDLSQGYKKLTDLAAKLVYNQKEGADFLEGFNASLQAIIAVDNKKQQSDETAKIRDDAKQAREEQYEQRQKQLQAESARVLEQANSEKISAVTRMLLNQQEAFSRSLSEINEKARQSVFKLREEIGKQELVQNNSKNTQKTRDAATKAIKVANEDIKAIQKANYDEIEQMTIDHNYKMQEDLKKGSLEVSKTIIAETNDFRTKELATIENDYQSHILKLNEEDHVYEENIRKLNKEITAKQKELNSETSTDKKKALSDELNALQVTLSTETELLGQNSDLAQSFERKKQKAIDDTNKKFDLQTQLYKDQTAIIQAQISGGKNNPFNYKLENAEVKQAQDELKSELQNQGLAGNKNDDGTKFTADQLAHKEELTKASELRIKEIQDGYRKQRVQLETQASETIANAGFQILQNSLQQSFQAKEVALNREKGYELSNQALTATQQYEVSEKYRVLEGQAKQREFKQEQELNMAKVAMDGALAILKTNAELGWPAAIPADAIIITETLAQEAVIAAQRAPAYATGGVHVGNGMVKGAGTGTSDSINARLSNGEAVINANSTRQYAPLLSAINVAGGGIPFDKTIGLMSKTLIPGFATGGLVSTSYLPTTDNGLRANTNVQYRFHPDDISSMASAIFDSIKTMPAPVTDIKDINYQQQRLAKPYDRLNY